LLPKEAVANTLNRDSSPRFQELPVEKLPEIPVVPSEEIGSTPCDKITA